METNLPLVSVPVITYNSSKTVIETLDSVSNQTYSDIELIVSDDCSTDNTVEVCREWVEKHKERFVRTKILVTERNTGVAANLNRAESVCKGGWVKPIAGDDLLLPNCIKDLVDCVGTHPKALIIIGQMQVMGGDEDFRNSFYKVLKRNFEQLSQLSHEELYERVLEGNGIPAPAVFYSKTLLDRYGKLNDERIVFIEDWPKWIKLLRDGFFPVFLDKEVVRYRLGGISGSVVWDSLALYKDKRRIFFTINGIISTIRIKKCLLKKL